MSKERIQRLVLGLVVILFVASALGYLLVPAAMLRIVGMDSDPQVTFLVRTIPPPCWRYLQVPGRHGAGTARRGSVAS
jgi:hypothetical protein